MTARWQRKNSHWGWYIPPPKQLCDAQNAVLRRCAVCERDSIGSLENRRREPVRNNFRVGRP